MAGHADSIIAFLSLSSSGSPSFFFCSARAFSVLAFALASHSPFLFALRSTGEVWPPGGPGSREFKRIVTGPFGGKACQQGLQEKALKGCTHVVDHRNIHHCSKLRKGEGAQHPRRCDTTPEERLGSLVHPLSFRVGIASQVRSGMYYT